MRGYHKYLLVIFLVIGTGTVLHHFKKKRDAAIARNKAVTDTLHFHASQAENPEQNQPAADKPTFEFKNINLSDTTDRLMAILECASCHPKAYENWKEGPHAASFSKMVENYDIITQSGHFPASYANWIEGNMHICGGCHVSQNVFETSLAGMENITDLDAITPSTHPDVFKMAVVRDNPATYSTGTDCITCHYNGERIITSGDFTPDPQKTEMPGYCNPLPSPFFDSNLNCISCHKIHFENLERLHSPDISVDLITAETNCVSCHMETDSDGKRTHYFHWRHDDPQKHPRKEVKGGIFKALKTDMVTGDTSRLNIRWKNNLYPHCFSECGEVVVFLTIKDRNGKTHLVKDVRLNRKIIHDKDLQKQMGGEAPTGKVGYTFNPDDPEFTDTFPIPFAFKGGGSIELKAYDKGQYWADDAIGDLIWEEIRKF